VGEPVVIWPILSPTMTVSPTLARGLPPLFSWICAPRRFTPLFPWTVTVTPWTVTLEPA